MKKQKIIMLKMFERFIIIFTYSIFVFTSSGRIISAEDSVTTDISQENSEITSTDKTKFPEEMNISNTNSKPPSNKQDFKTPEVSKEINDVLDFLRKGNEVVQFSPNNDTVLLLGNTGSGKTTLAQLLLGEEGQLISEEVAKGTSEYLIVDKDNKISRNSTVISQTVYPDLFFDNKTRTAYYDCPGFSDTRSSAHEITATYFIKKILDSSRAAKLVFVASHHSLRKGLDRKNFILMLKHAVDLVKNVKKYKDSMVLIVTKVENTYIENDDGSINLVPDEVLVTSIADFLFSVKIDINSNPKLLSYGHDEVNQLLDGLLKNKDGKYTRIGIFKRPNKAGPIHEMKLLQKEKETLQKIIEENIKFTQIDKGDFGYTVSSDSKLQINDLIEEIIMFIVNELKSLGKDIEKYYEDKEEQLPVFEGYFEKLSKTFSSLKKEATTDTISFNEYLDNVNEIIADLNITVSSKYLSNISVNIAFIDFLYLVGNQSKSASSSSSKLAVGFAEVTDYMSKTDLWYRYLKTLFNKLSQYEVQKHKDDFISNLNDLPDLKEGIKFSEIDWNPPISKVIEETLIENYEVKDVAINIPKQVRLYELLQQTLNHTVELFCESNMLEVRGVFVQLSITQEEECDYNMIKVYALYKVFIDASLDFTGKEVEMAIVAPTWEVVGSQSILLNGQNGLEYESLKAYNKENGKPGRPGGPAGNFFGIGEKMVNDESLSITANGGDGGTGQNGGDGIDGSDAQPDWDGTITKLIPLIVYNNIEWTIPGASGTNGGDGGSGGYGGYKGNIYFMKLDTNNPLKIRMTADEGVPGAEGDGGSGGSGGRYGKFVRQNFLIFINEDKLDLNNERALSGSRGILGANTQGKQNTRRLINNLNFTEIICSYRDYASNNLKGSISEKCLNDFLFDIENKTSLSALRIT